MEKTWNDAAERWLKSRAGHRWQKQEEGYVTRLTHYLDGKPLKEITKGVVADIRDGLLEHRQAPTVNRHLTVLRAILNRAKDDWDWVDSVPKIRKVEEGQPRERYLEKDEARKLIQCCPPHLRDKVILALSTGLRDRNIRELRWDEVDLPNRQITIPGTKMKSGKTTTIPINEVAWELLRKRRKSTSRHPEWVFAYGGKPVHRSGTRAFRKALKRAGIEDFRWHDLRHTWASWHVQAGTHTAAVRELGGWSDDRMVKRYAHLSTKHLRKQAENIGGL